MKMTNGIHVIETTEFLKNIWEREGYKEYKEEQPQEQPQEQPKNKGGRPKAKP